jgi:hypothetical protein
VEKLKGVTIEKVVCGAHRTFAIDDKGQLYAWGKGYGSFPTLLDHFVKEKIYVVDVAPATDRLILEYELTLPAHESDLPKGVTLFLSDIGEVYWTSATSLTPKKFEPISDHFVVQVAVAEKSAYFLTDNGEVFAWYTHPNSSFFEVFFIDVRSGRWIDGECGCLPMSSDGMRSHKDEDGMPRYAYRVWLPPRTEIAYINAYYDTACGIDVTGRLWLWGESFS